MPERTITELTVLAMLGHRGPRERSGYDLKKFADDSLGYLWAPSKTQLYATLRRLVAAGLVSRRDVRQSHRPDKQLYKLTAAGHRAVREWLDADEEEGDPDRSLFMLKFFFASQAAPEAIGRQLVRFREAYAERLRTYEAIALESAPETRDPYTFLALQYGIARARAAVEWARRAARELQAVSA